MYRRGAAELKVQSLDSEHQAACGSEVAGGRLWSGDFSEICRCVSSDAFASERRDLVVDPG